MWIKHPRSGQKDTMLTIAIFGAAIIFVKVLLNGVQVAIGGFSFDFGSIDGILVAAVLTPTLGAYVTRKFKSPPPDKLKEK